MMSDPNISIMEGSYGIWNTIRLILLVAAGLVAVAIAVASVVGAQKGETLSKAKDRQRDVQIETVRAQAAKDIENIRADAERGRQEAEVKIASLGSQAESLRADAEKAKKEIAVARVQAAQANEKAEGERLKRTQLEASFEPRSLDKDGSDSWQDMRLFAGTKVLIVALGMEPEVHRFSQELAMYLNSVGWNAQAAGNTSMLGIGITITSTKKTAEEPDNKWNDAATILGFFLKDCGVEAGVWSPRISEEHESERDRVVVEVGSKRQWYFDSKRANEREDAFIERLAKEANDAIPEARKIVDEVRKKTEANRPLHKDLDPEQNRKLPLRYDPKEKSRILKKYDPSR
jgi:hypothetical protein